MDEIKIYLCHFVPGSVCGTNLFISALGTQSLAWNPKMAHSRVPMAEYQPLVGCSGIICIVLLRRCVRLVIYSQIIRHSCKEAQSVCRLKCLLHSCQTAHSAGQFWTWFKNFASMGYPPTLGC